MASGLISVAVTNEASFEAGQGTAQAISLGSCVQPIEFRPDE